MAVSSGGAPFEGGAGSTPSSWGGLLEDLPLVVVAGRAGLGEAGHGGMTTAECDSESLLRAISEASVGLLGACTITESVPGPDETSRRRGAVVFDGEGRVIDNTGLLGAKKQAWLDELGDQRWICWANETIGYQCRLGG